jgi:undecaprenyl-diphosphatase
MDWGVRVILALQQYSPTLDGLFAALTMVSDTEFYMLALPFVYLSVDRRTGARLTAWVLLSTYLNAAAKVLAGQPRPAEYDASVRALREAMRGGFPSGHTQNVVVTWGYLSARYRRRWLWALTGVLIVLVPLSRVYLGVHFPHDLLGGYLLGAGLLFGVLAVEDRVGRWVSQLALAWRVALPVVGGVVLALLVRGEDTAAVSATLSGLGAGYALERQWVRFALHASWWRRIAGYVLAVAILVATWYGLRLAFEGLAPAPLLRYVRYAIVGLWGGLGAPWLLVRARLAVVEEDKEGVL